MTDTEATPAAANASPGRHSPFAEDEGFVDGHRASASPAGGADEEPGGDEGEPIFLSQTVRRMGRRRTRVLAVLALLVALAGTVAIVSAFVRPEPVTPVEQATGQAWSAVRELSDGLRELGPDGELQPLRDEARTAREEVQAARTRLEALALPTAQTPLRRRVIRALRVDDAWIDAVGSTLSNPRSSRRRDLSRLARRAAVATTLIEGDVPAAANSVGGTGRLLSATRGGG